MVRKLNLKLPESKDLDLDQQDLDFINYYTSLRNCNAIEVSDSNFCRVKTVIDYFEADDGTKRIISSHAHLLELGQGRQSGRARIKWFKAVTKHMNYNHYYCLAEMKGVQFLDLTFQVEMVDKSPPPYKKSSLLREL